MEKAFQFYYFQLVDNNKSRSRASNFLFTNIRNPNNISSYYMRGTKKRMMYKKRRDTKLRKRKTTKKMRGGYINYFTKEQYYNISDDERDKFNAVLNDEFQHWRAIRQQENKNSSYKKLSRGFRGIFKNETRENLEAKFMDSDFAKNIINKIKPTIDLKQTFQENKSKNLENLGRMIENKGNEERLELEEKNKLEKFKKEIEELQELQEKIKKLEELKEKLEEEKQYDTGFGKKTKEDEIENLKKDLKKLKELYDKNNITFTDDDDAEFQGGKKRRTRRKDKRKYK